MTVRLTSHVMPLATFYTLTTQCCLPPQRQRSLDGRILEPTTRLGLFRRFRGLLIRTLYAMSPQALIWICQAVCIPDVCQLRSTFDSYIVLPGSSADGTQVIGYHKNDSLNQQWAIIRTDGYYK